MFCLYLPCNVRQLTDVIFQWSQAVRSLAGMITWKPFPASAGSFPLQARPGHALKYRGGVSVWTGQMMTSFVVLSQPYKPRRERSEWLGRGTGDISDFCWHSGSHQPSRICHPPTSQAPCREQGQIGESIARPPGQQDLPKPLAASKPSLTKGTPSALVTISCLWAISQ